jgi:hypothetical protein
MVEPALCIKLLQLYGRGEIAATTVRDIAAAAWTDGWGRGNPLAARLASAGAAGVHRNHIARDIIRAADAAGLVSSMCMPYEVDISTGGKALLYLPHEAMPMMIQGTSLTRWCLPRAAFDRGDPLAEQVARWCRDEDVGFHGDPATIPVIGLHCDGVQYTASIRAGTAKSMIVGAFNFVTAQGAADVLKRHPFFVLRSTRYLGD